MPISNKEKRADIANRIKYARVCAKLTQADVAKKLGITPQAISNYERGTNAVPNSVLFKMAELFNITSDYLLCVTNTPVPISKSLVDLIGDTAVTLTPAETQSLSELRVAFSALCKSITSTDDIHFPAIIECLISSIDCLQSIYRSYESNGKYLLLYDAALKAANAADHSSTATTELLNALPEFKKNIGAANFASESLSATDTMQNTYARLIISMQANLSNMEQKEKQSPQPPECGE